MAGDTSIDMMINVLPGTLTGIFALNAGLSSINQQFQNMTKAVDNHFGIVDAAIVSASALAIQFGKTAADAFGEYEQGMKIVQAVSGQSASAIAELGQKANEFSVQYRMDINELTDGLQTLGRAGLKSATEQSEVLENGLQTAKLEGRDLNSVLEELLQNTTLLGGDLKSANFGEQTQYVNDLLVATSMTAPINTHDVSETLKYSGGIAAAAGANIETEEGKDLLEDYMASIAAFAQKGVKGSIAGTALRAFFNKPATQDASVVEGLSMIGLKPEYLWEDDQQTMKPISEQISLIQSQMDKKNISQMDRLQIWSKIVGGKMGQQMMKLDGGDIRSITKDIKEANSAEKLATQSMQSYQSALKQTGEAGQMAFRAFGEHVARFLKPVAQTLTPILEALANPVISTAAFTGFIALIGQAVNSIRKIFSALRVEIGMVRNLFNSMVLNQPRRREIVGGQLHGGGVVPGFQESEKIKQDMNVATAKVKEATTDVRVTSAEVGPQTLKVIEQIRDRMTAINNRIKEELEAVNAFIAEWKTKLDSNISSSATKMKTEFDAQSSSVITSASAKVNRNITASAAKMKTEFTAAMAALTFTPNFNKTMFTGPVGANAMFRDGSSRFSGTYSYLATELKTMENDFKKEMTGFAEKNNPMLLRNTMYSSISKEEGAIKKLTEKRDSYGKQANALKMQRYNFNKEHGLSPGDKGYVTKGHKELFLETQYGLLDEEILIRQKFVAKLKSKMAYLESELNAMKIIGKPLAPPVAGPKVSYMPGTTPVNIPQEYRPTSFSPSKIDFAYKSYGYTSSGAMPAPSGHYGAFNVPSTYLPNTSISGTEHTPWKFGIGTGTGKSLLAHLRSEEVAITKEMQAKLGISNSELSVFYERLMEVNRALAKTATVTNGKETIRSGAAAETAYQKKLAGDSLYKTKGNMVPIYSSSQNRELSGREVRGIRSLFGQNNGLSSKEFEKEFKDSRREIKNRLDTTSRNIKELSRYNLGAGVYSENQVNSMLGKSPSSFGQAGGGLSTQAYGGTYLTRELIDKTVRMQETSLKQRLSKGLNNTLHLSGASNIVKATSGAVKGFSGALSKVTSYMGGPFFAAMMVIDVGMQIWNSAYQNYAKKVEEATNKLDEAIQKQEDAVDIFYNGKHEEGEREFTGWSEENPDATAEEKEDALLAAYGDIYDNRDKSLTALDENTQQLAIATSEVQRATEAIQHSYLDGGFFSGNGFFSKADANQIANGNTNIGTLFESGSPMEDKYGELVQYSGKDFFQNGEILLSEKQEAEDYPWLKEFSPIFASDIWKTGSTESSMRGMFGNAGYAKLDDMYSSIGGWDNSAWTRHGYNVNKYFGDDESQNKLQMGLKNYGKEFSKLAKQTRRFEKATGSTALGAFNKQYGKFKNVKKALNNLSVQDPKLVSYIKSLSIETGMSEQQVLMAAQLQQLQDMKDIADNQVTPQLMSLVSTSYDQVAYGGQTLSTVQGSGEGAVSAAQNAAAIAALLQVKVEGELGKKVFQQYTDDLKGEEGKYKTPEQLMAASKDAHNRAMRGELPKDQEWLLQYYDNYMQSYAEVNSRLFNPQGSPDAYKKAGEAFMEESAKNKASSNAMLDTLRKGLNAGATRQILTAYDASLNDQESSGSGGGSGSGSNKDNDKDKDTGVKKERVDLVLCNKKEIPKLNVNLFKKPPTFTVLNKNFKLRDVKINTQDKPKAIMASIKNAFIDVQKRSDPKIIQDEEAEYDPAGATEGNAVPSGEAKTKTNR